jgi:hypothetical protein
VADNRDLVLPILQKMPADLTALRTKMDNVGERQLLDSDRIDAIHTSVVFHMGRTMEGEATIDSLREDLADLKRRVATLESRS